MKNPENSTIYITKASGTKVPFDPEKLRSSLQRAGASKETIDEIVGQVSSKLHERMGTKDIFRLAFSLLKKRNRPLAARYNLKRAIMDLGPSGFPFENYVAEILKFQGFNTMTGVSVQGKCVMHEVDVLAFKAGLLYMVECKFHNEPGHTCDVKTPLYIHARFQDIESFMDRQPNIEHKLNQGWLVTNTGFTVDAELYGTCVGLKLIGWNYPKEGNLRQLIDRAGLHPITAMTTLAKHDKLKLLERGVVLCMHICDTPALLDIINLKSNRAAQALEEAKELCGLV